MTVQKQPSPLIKNIDLGAGQKSGKNKEKPTIDEALEQIEGMEAEELLQSKARSVRAEYDLKTRETENRLRHIEGGATVDNDKKKEEGVKLAEQREKLIAQAKGLIDSGMEPTQVGQMLMGLSPTGLPPATSQGMGMKDVMEMVTMIVGRRETDELKGIITNLAKQVDELAKGGGVKTETKPLDPISFARQQAEAVVAWNKALEMLRPSNPPPTDKGEPLEIVKERNRHEERMEEVKTDRDYKAKLASAVTSLPEEIGRGMASRFTEEAGGGDSGSSGEGLSFIECEDCHTKIYTTPNTSKVTCPKCNTVYQAGETVESKAE